MDYSGILSYEKDITLGDCHENNTQNIKILQSGIQIFHQANLGKICFSTFVELGKDSLPSGPV